MARIVDGTVELDQAECWWFINHYGSTEWVVYTTHDEIITHDRQGAGEEPAGNPFTEQTAREYLAELDRRFGPGSPMDLKLRRPLYAVALHYGKPAFGSHAHVWPVVDGADGRGDCVCGAAYGVVEPVGA